VKKEENEAKTRGPSLIRTGGLIISMNKCTKHYEKLDVNDYSLAHFALILSLHYLVKCRSRGLAIYSNEFILGNTCVGSEMIN